MDQEALTGLAPLPHALETTCRAWLEHHARVKPFACLKKHAIDRPFETRRGVAFMIEELTARGVLVKQLEDAFLQTYFRTEIPGSAPLSLRFGVCEAASILQRRVDNRGAVWRTLQTTRGALSMIHTKIDAARKAAGEHMSEEEIAAFKELATDLDLARSLTEDLAADFKKKQDSDKARARAARHGSPKPQAKKKPGRKEKPDLV